MAYKYGKTYVYVDGFNLYYGCLKKTPHKWLNIHELCSLLFKNKCDIQKIRYFTAKVKPQAYDMSCDLRQQTYLRALKTIPNLEIHYGQFTSHVKNMPLDTPRGRKKFEKVIRTDEKGSDVNLASYILMDAFDDLYETAIVISNDSDLYTPLKMVRDKMKKRVILANPQKSVSHHLKGSSSFVAQIREGVLKASQFPNPLTDSHGQIVKPTDW